MQNFTPYSALIGGTLIGLSAAMLLFFNGKVAGISGIFYGAMDAQKNDKAWRWFFLLGLLFGGMISQYLGLIDFAMRQDFSWLLLCLAGVLVGFGTKMSNGCTSGHGVCGMARLSIRSVVAVLTFLMFAIISTYISRHIFGV